MTAQTAEVAQRPRRLWLAYLSGAFGLAMIAQANFLVPLRARELGASFDVIGLIVGAGAIAALVASLPSGALIDRLGPRRAFMVGTTATFALTLLFPLVTNYWWFLVLQPVLGIARNMAWTASQSYITSIGPVSRRSTMTGRFSLVSSVGQMIGPVMVGAAAGVVGFQWAFLVSAAYALAFTVVGFFLAETPRAQQASDPVEATGLRSAWGLLRLRGLQVVAVLTFARLWISSVYTTFLPVLLVDEGVTPGVVGAVIATSGLVAAAAAPTAGFWTRRWPPLTVSVAALMCGAAALALTPFALDLPWVFVIPVLVGLGAGVSWPLLLTIVTTAAPERQRGVALGLRSMAAQGAMTTSPLVVGPLVTLVGMTLGFTVAGAVAAGMLLWARFLVRRP